MVFCSIYFYKTMRENMIIWEKSVKRNQGLYASFLKKIKADPKIPDFMKLFSKRSNKNIFNKKSSVFK